MYTDATVCRVKQLWILQPEEHVPKVLVAVIAGAFIFLCILGLDEWVVLVNCQENPGGHGKK